MSDPTPEERAASIDYGDPREREVGGIELWVTAEIRAAVDAEREHWQSKYTASQEALTELLTEHRKLIEALEAN
jgi:hypothetical protein